MFSEARLRYNDIMTTLNSLINCAPFSEKVKKDLLEKVTSMSADQKFRLEQLCWGGISKMHEIEMRHMVEEAFNNMSKTGKPLTPNDLAEMEARLIYKFAQDLKSAESQDQIEEVRDKIKSLQVKKKGSSPVSKNKPQ